MPTPFPGMDPYLERSGLWNQVHHDLISDIRRYLLPLLRPDYIITIEQRTYLSLMPPNQQLIGIPDVLAILPKTPANPTNAVVIAPPKPEPMLIQLPAGEEIIEQYLEIREVENQEVVTVIEVLSPVNKVNPKGRHEYLTKRLKILSSWTNLVEIDLLRAGKPLPMHLPHPKSSHYRIITSRYHQRPHALAYLFNVREIIPDISIPLLPDEPEPLLPLNQILHTMYDESGYDLQIDYHQPPPPPQFDDETTTWLQNIIVI
jgi:hypothetical protein